MFAGFNKTGLLGAALACGIVIAAATASPDKQQAKNPKFRKTTDPPVRAEGKLGQDLFLAIDHRDCEAVKALLKKGADPNARNGLQFLPLYIAAAGHQQDVMQALLSAGAQADGESPYGTPLGFAALTANLEGANLLFPKKVNVNYARVDGNTVLMMSCYSGRPDFVAELLKRKANVNAKNDSGATALTFAARFKNMVAGQMLVGAGAKVDSRDDEGQTPLMTACLSGSSDFVKMLLDKGANPNLKDKKGRTALMLSATVFDNPEIISALIAHGADPSITDPKGRTAGALAAARGFENSAKLLGASVNETTPYREPGKAAALSLKLLEYSMTEFNRNAGCISCHQEGLGRMASASARDHGFATSKALQKDQTERIGEALKMLQPLHAMAAKNSEAMKQVPLIEINEVNTGDGWLLAGMAAQNDAPNAGTAAMALVLARQQSPNGAWTFSLPRTPMQSSLFTFTALAVRSMKAYAPKANAAEIAERVAKAKTFLMQTPTQTSDDRAFRLLGLKWAGASLDERKVATSDLMATQRADGGWSQTPDSMSDAYATGQAIYALRTAGGIEASDPVIERGVKYLLRTQDDDGSWFVSKRALPANNYFDASFPGGESQYASFNATCWGTMALLEATPAKGTGATRR